MKHIFLATSLLLLLQCCQQKQTLKQKQAEITNGKIDDSLKYICNEIGWQTYLPKDWSVMTKAQNDTLNNKGKKMIEEGAGIKVDPSKLKQLLNLKKDAFNCFISTIEPYDEKKDGNYAQHNGDIYKLISDTYKKQNIKFKLSEDSEMIDKIKFYTMKTEIYSPQGPDKIIMYQKMYSQLLNNYDFGMTIIYNNETDKAILMKIINNSKFLR